MQQPDNQPLLAASPVMLVRRAAYYARSILTLLRGVAPWPLVVAVFLGARPPTPFTIRLPRRGLRFKVRTAMDIWIVKETCLDRDYDGVGVPVAAGWHVLDVGGALGDWAVDAARQAALVHVYEPFPRSFELLAENLRLNAVANVAAFNAAVASAPGAVQLDVSTAVAVRHSTVAGGGLVVPAVSLAEALGRLPGGRCDLLKLDCEGAEYEILMGAPAAALRAVDRIVLEYHEGVVAHTGAELAAFLRARGYVVRIAPSSVKPDIGLLYASRAR